jgi:hypothetical protein
MVDSKNLIYLPAWVKVVSIAILSLCLIFSMAIALSFIGQPDRSDWILLAMSIAQVTASGLVLSLVVFFSERDLSVSALRQKSEEFSKVHMVNALSKIAFESDNPPSTTEVFFEDGNDLCGGLFNITNGHRKTRPVDRHKCETHHSHLLHAWQR